MGPCTQSGSFKHLCLKVNPGLYCKRDTDKKFIVCDNDGHALVRSSHAYLAWFEVHKCFEYQKAHGTGFACTYRDLRWMFSP